MVSQMQAEQVCEWETSKCNGEDEQVEACQIFCVRIE